MAPRLQARTRRVWVSRLGLGMASGGKGTSASRVRRASSRAWGDGRVFTVFGLVRGEGTADLHGAILQRDFPQ